MNVIKIGEQIRIFGDNIKQIKFENGKVYSIEYSPVGGPYIVEAPIFRDPEDFFYEDEGFHDHILKTFESQSTNVGVCFCGYKGQGKTVSAKVLANRINLPIFTITHQVSRDFDLIAFLNQIECEYTLFIDEFEKIFKKDNSDKDNDYHSESIFLSFLDGSNSSKYKKLIVLTCNQDIGEYFINRPSRIRYYKKYNFISDALYQNIIDRLLKNKGFEKDLKDNLQIKDATVDLIKSIITEINIHNKPYSSFKSFYNHRESTVTYSRYIYSETTQSFSWDSDLDFNREINKDNFEDLIYGAKIIKVEGGSIFYKTKDYVLRKKKRVYADVIYKLKKSVDLKGNKTLAYTIESEN